MVFEENKSYVIILTSDFSLVDFSEVLESPEYLRYSLDQTKFIVKYEGEMPLSISSIEGASSEYTYAEILVEIKGSSWHPEDDDPIV